MKSRKRKKLLITLSVIAFVVIALVIILPKLLNLDRYKGFIISEIEQAVGAKVSIGHISWGISKGIWLETDRFSMTGATTFPVDLDFPHVFAKISILPLLRKRIDVSELRLEAPKARVRLAPPSLNNAHTEKKRPRKGVQSDHSGPFGLSLLGATPHATASETTDQDMLGKLLPVEINIEELSIHRGQIALDDTLTLPGQKVERNFTDVEVEAAGIKPGETAVFIMSFRDEAPSGLGPIEVRGTFHGLSKTFVIEKPELKISGVFSRLHTDAIKPYFGIDRLDHRLGGHVSLEMNYYGDFGDHFDLEGVVGLTNMTFSAPSLWARPLPGAETKFHFQAGFSPQDITIDETALTVGNLSIAGRAQIVHWRERPLIKNAVMSARLAFSELAPLIPWELLGKSAQILRPILESGGSLQIEEITIPELDPAVSFSEPAKILSNIGMTARLSDISVPPTPNIPRIDGITGMVQMNEGVIHIMGLKARTLSTELPALSGKIDRILENPTLQARAQGALTLPEPMEDESKEFLKKLGITQLSGTADLDLVLEMDTAKPKDFDLQGKMSLQDFQVKTTFSPASFEEINSDLVFTPDELKITAFSGKVRTPQTKESRSKGFTLALKGKVEDWHRQPVILVQHLSTSPVSLPSLVPLFPWEKLKDVADPVKETLLAGGTVAIDEITLPGINLMKPPKTARDILPKAKARVSFSHITMRPLAGFPPIEEIHGHITLDQGTLTVADMIGRMGPFRFPTIKAKVTGLGGQIQAAVSLKGPMSVQGTQDVAIEELLRKYGLNSFTGAAEIDMSLQYDQKTPHLWSANCALALKKINAESYPEAIRLENLQGEIYLKKEKTLELIVNKLRANINKAPVGLNAILAKGGTPQMLIQGKVYAKDLDLADVNAFLPKGDELKLTGKLDLDVDIRFPYAKPLQTRMVGKLKTHAFGIYLNALDALVKEGNADVAFKEDTIQVKQMSFKANDQKIGLEGSFADPGDPKFFLQIDSPHLNVDRLIPAIGGGQKPRESQEVGVHTAGDGAPGQSKEEKPELPLWAHKVHGDIQVEIAQGVYKQKPFHGLKLDARYERGVVKPYDLDFHMAKGQFQAHGCLDLRDLDKVEFVLNPTITALPLETLAPLFGLEKPPIYGPISVRGQLTGHTLNPEDLLPDLAGTINLEVGAGRLPEIKQTGQFFASILSILNITGIFSGALSDTMREKGLPFKSIHSAISMDAAKLKVDHFLFLSSALNVSSQGTIDLLSQEVDMKAALAPLVTLDKIIGIVPLLGKQAQKLTQIYLSIEGSLKDPKVKKTLAKGVGSVITSAIRAPKTFIDDVSSSPEKKEGVSPGSHDEDLLSSQGCGVDAAPYK